MLFLYLDNNSKFLFLNLRFISFSDNIVGIIFSLRKNIIYKYNTAIDIETPLNFFRIYFFKNETFPTAIIITSTD